jgi:hypothetical protein
LGGCVSRDPGRQRPACRGAWAWRLGKSLWYEPLPDKSDPLFFWDLLRFDVYPERPLVFHFGATLEVLGRSFMLESQGTIGIELDRAELYAGYSTWVIGQTVLQGPLAGVRVTF